MYEGEPPTPEQIPELYRDDSLLIVDKPAGLPMHPSNRYLHGTVVGRLRATYGEAFAAPVHRLDRETSGVVVCARHREAARSLTRSFTQGTVQKTYTAIVEGHPPEDAFTVEAPIAVGGRVVRIATRVDFEAGKPARTDFTVEARFQRDAAPFAIVQARPATGRRHQIRLHLRHMGFPIVGDKIYGHDENDYVRFCEMRLDAAAWARLRLPRHALHASTIRFAHPLHREIVQFDAPWPVDLQAFCTGKPC